MKKLLFALVFVLAGTLTVSAAPITSTGTKPSVGNGDKNNPFEIRTAEELRWFVHYENTRHWFPNDYAKLMADIDLSSICGPDKGSWIPLGNSEENGAKDHWYGSLEGNGYTISGLYIDYLDLKTVSVGFCGKVSEAKISNLTVKGDIYRAGGYTGGLIGWNYEDCATINNCVSNVNIHLYNMDALVGGLIGYCTATGTDGAYYITNCTYEGKISGGNLYVSSCGTLVGCMKGSSSLKFCSGYCGYADSDSSGSEFAIPLIGYCNSSINVTYCLSDAYIIGEYNSSSTILSYNYYGGCGEIERKNALYYDDFTSSMLPHSSFGNGEACYKMNQRIGGQYFKQTLGTQKVPYANGSGNTVYLVKVYTHCGSDNFYYDYSNSSSDINERRQHIFVDDEPYCTACHEAVNPDYGISKDGEGYYLAGSDKDIMWIWNLVNVTGVTDANIRLTADIDMKGEAIAPLAEFSGVIDGQNHRLDNINISGTSIDRLGLVGTLSGTVRNLVLSGSVEGTYVSFMGAVAGFVSKTGSISNVLSECTVKATGTMNGSMCMYIGGVAGYVAGTASDCINNGPVVDASTCTGTFRRYIAGVVGYATDIAHINRLVNNAVVGASSDATPVDDNGNAVANLFYPTDIHSYYVTGISNPGLGCFYSNTANDYDTSVSPIDVGSGRLAWLLAGKDYDAGDAATVFFGQTVGTDMILYPFVNEEHKGVYKTRHYYTCDSYSDYSNSSTDEVPKAHTWNASHFCSVCCAIDTEYVPQDAQTKAYLISTPEQYNIFVTAINATYDTDKPMRYASASIQNDLDFSSTSVKLLFQLHGRLHGNGHRITFGSGNSNYSIATSVGEDGIIEHLDVVYPSDNFYAMVGTNLGQIVGCNITRGVPTGRSAGLVIDCSGELQSTNNLYGRFTRCVVKTFTIEGAKNYRLYNSNVADNVDATYTEIALEKGETGELAYTLSHGSGNCEWGQELNKDADPRIRFGQTPTSDTYVTNLTTYSAEHPEGKVEYVNAGKGLEATPGCYKVCKDIESWTTLPAYNFIIDKGDGTYTAEHINIDPTMQNYLPISVQADKLTFKEANSEGKLVAKDYGFGEILSLVFPVAMPVSNVNGHVHIFDGYDALNNTLVFTSSLDEGDCTIPANTPVLVKTYGGSILNADMTNVTIEPMTVAGYSELENVRHLTNYQQQTLPTDKALEDGGYVLYYVLNGDKALLAANNTNTVGQFASYFRVPYISASSTQSEISVALVEDRELKTSRIIERDLFSIPYGSIDENAEWQKVSHLSDPNVFYGNDITCDNYANISAYDFLYIHGKPGQKYYFYFNGSDATEVAIDNDGDAFIELNDHRVGIGDVYLRGIRLAEGETVADDAFAKVYKDLDDGLVLYGYGDFSDDLKGYPFYDATGVKCGITLSLDNPNAMVVGGSNVKGVYNRIEKSEDVMQGFTAEKLRLTDGGDFCYDYSVKCPDVTFTRYDVPAEMRYVTFVLPFAAKYVKGMHEYIDCDGENVYFNTPEDGVIDAYLPIVIDMEEYEGRTITITGEDFLALSPNGTFNVAPVPSTKYDLKYGFVKKEQQNVPLTNAEVADYDIYNFSTNSYQFVRATDTFSISPFRAFFMLPKNTTTRVKGFAAPQAECKVLNIVLDGEEITTGITNINVDDAGVGNTYNILGQPVGSGYKGVVIKNNQKIIIK